MRKTNLDIILKRRRHSAKALYDALSFLLNQSKPFSEVDLRDRVLFELRKSKETFPDGWYMPPPNGIGIIFSTDKDFKRSNFINLRHKEFWPRKDIFFDRENGIITAYTSCVDKKTHLIADFGLTLYFGDKKIIQDNIDIILNLQKEIFSYAKIGMRVSEVYRYAEALYKKNNYSNDWWLNITDPSGNNIGHTFPGTCGDWTKEENDVFKKGKWEDACMVISKKRIFISPAVDKKITPGMVFTIEPRLKLKGETEIPIIFFHALVAFDEKGNKHFVTDFDKLLALSEMKNKKTEKITYEEVGDNYDTKDPIKKMAQVSAVKTGKNLIKHGFKELTETRGESAYVWQQGKILMATVTEQLGTKNLVADGTRKITKKTYYDVIGYDTIGTIINDLISVGAQPLVVNAYWAIENNDWLADTKRMEDLISGWKNACDLSGASWGGGETPTLKGIMIPDTVALGGSAIGIISSRKRLIIDSKLKNGDRIILLKSNGINANGLSLARAIAKKLPKGYATKMANGEIYGEAILKKTNIYAKLVQNLLDNNIDIHYISNITGHGLRKLMRARYNFSYIVEKLFPPQELFLFLQKHANLTDYEMYEEFNMGQDYAIFIPAKDVKKTLAIIKKNKFHGLDAGHVEKGLRQVILKTKNITFDGSRLDLR